MTKARNLADLLNADGQIDNADIAGGVNFKNIIINGDMSIAQRGTSQASAGSSGGSYQTLDRWKFLDNGLGAFTWSQDTDVPTGQGFAKSMKFDCTTADAAPASNKYLQLQTKFEGQNLQYLKKGTASAESTTLSFWVKSNKTGTYITELRDVDNDRVICKAYTINSASTWEKKTITFEGDTTGTLDNDNGGSLDCNFWLGVGTDFSSGTLQTSWNSVTSANRAVGQVNLADNTANNFWITGVQLEAGTTASDFEFLPYDVNLQRCQRYYQKNDCTSGYISGYNTTNDYVSNHINLPVTMRATPSASTTGSPSLSNIVQTGVTAISPTSFYWYIRATTTGDMSIFGDITFIMSSEL